MSVTQIGENSWIDDYNQVIINVHKPNQCRNEYCTVHNPSGHSMLSFPQMWRQDRGFMERVCPHGIGHPDPDDLMLDRTHACDGCCSDVL
jgi:hypothetical protein